MNWSEYQEKIFEHIDGMFHNGNENLTVRAYAGTGKTTTLVEGLHHVPAHVKSVFCAFNKSIQLELQNRLPDTIQASTLHSLGFSNIRKFSSGKRIKVHNYKMHDIFDVLEPPPHKYAEPEIKAYHRAKKSAFVKATSFVKNLLVDYDDSDAVWDMMGELDLEGFESEIVPLIKPGMDMSLNNETEVDFDDMIWLPASQRMPIEQFGFLAVDEAQDLNPAQIRLVLKSINGGGKAVVIGDERQSIYGFRGADRYAMNRLASALKTESLPLPITYRCPVSVVELAREFVPDLQYRPGAPDGIVAEIMESKMHQLAQEGDMVLCRINAPLVPLAYGFIKAGKKATVMGKDIGKNLASLAQKAVAGSETMKDFYFLLNEMREREIDKVLNNPLIKNTAGKIARIEDQYDVIVAVADSDFVTIPSDVPVQIQKLFDDNRTGVVLSTVHRAKGLEAHRVFIVRPDLMPHPLARSEHAIEQEKNLQYVAITRSKSELYFVY